MPHPEELMELCIQKLMEEYPTNEYTYKLDLAIPGTKIRPDIQILKRDEIICVSEIGYTRADKIQIYRNLGIKDIRWYSKNMELILHEKDKEFINEEQENRIYKQILQEKKDEYSEKLSKILNQHCKTTEEILRQDNFFLTWPEECDFCLEERLEENNGSGIFLYFDRKRYDIFFECDNNPEHDYEESYKWNDEEGPYYGRLDEFLEMFIDSIMNHLKNGSIGSIKKVF